MMVVILAGTVREGDEYRKVAGLARSDVLIPSSPAAFSGLVLHDGDLIVEFPSFDSHPKAEKMRHLLRHRLKRCGANPPWERITG